MNYIGWNHREASALKLVLGYSVKCLKIFILFILTKLHSVMSLSLQEGSFLLLPLGDVFFSLS